MKMKNAMFMLAAVLLCSCSRVKENEVQEKAENEVTEQEGLYEKLSEYQLETQEDVEKYFRDFGDFTVKYKAVATAARGLDKNGEWEYAEWEPCEFDIILNCDLAAICAFSEEIKIYYLNDYWADEDSRDVASFTQFHLSGLDEQDREIEVLLQPAEEGMLDLCVTYSDSQILYKMFMTRSR